MHTVNLKVLPLIVVGILILIASFQAKAFVVTGTGTVYPADSSISGESIEFSFSYDVSDFGNRTLSPSVGAYYALRPIPVKVTGSISGAISNDDPIYRVVLWDAGFGLGYDDLQFDVRHENGNAAVAASAFNPSGNAFTSPLPDSFADAHELFFPQINNQAAWFSQSTGEIAGRTLIDMKWRIVPAPGTFYLLSIGLLSFSLLRIVRRKRNRPAVE